MVINFKTSVVSLLTLAFTFAAHAQTAPPAASDPTAGLERMYEFKHCDTKPSADVECSGIYKKMMSPSSSGGDECASVATDFSTAVKDAAKACSDAGISDCNVFAQCEIREMDSVDYTADDGADKEDKINSACPAHAAVGLQEVKDQLKAEQDAIDKMKETVKTAQADLAAAEKAGNEAIQKLTDAQKKAADDHSKEVQGMRKDSQTQEGTITNKLVTYQQEIDATNDKLRNVPIERAQDEIQYQNQKAQTAISCGDLAIKEAGEAQARVAALIAQNKFARGSFNSLAKNIGFGKQSKWQAMVDERFAICMRNQRGSSATTIADNTHDAQRAARNKEVTDLTLHIQSVRASMLQVKNGEACGMVMIVPGAAPTSNMNTELCKNVSATYQALGQSEQTYNTAQKTTSDQIVAARNQAAKDWNDKNKLYDTAQKDLKSAQTRAANLTAVIAVKNAKGMGASATQAQFAAALSGFNSEQAAADTMIACSQKNATSADYCLTGLCSQAVKIKQAVDSSYDPPDAIVKNPGSAETNPLRGTASLGGAPIGSPAPAPAPSPAETGAVRDGARDVRDSPTWHGGGF